MSTITYHHHVKSAKVDVIRRQDLKVEDIVLYGNVLMNVKEINNRYHEIVLVPLASHENDHEALKQVTNFTFYFKTTVEDCTFENE
jgi:hypothetical protein